MGENYEEFIAISSRARDPIDIPDNISLPDYLLRHLNANLPRLKGKPWVVDVNTKQLIKFDEVESLSRRVASALTRRGFKKGDTLYYVTFESARLYMILMAVWRLGGISRGWYQRDTTDIYRSNMLQSRPKFVLLDEETRPYLHETISMLDYEFQLFCFGDVEGVTSVDELFNDDGSAFPEHVQINPREDVVFIIGTSGSTGEPKGVMHSHYTAVAGIISESNYYPGYNSCLLNMTNFSIGMMGSAKNALYNGCTIYIIPQLNKDIYFDILEEYKPEHLPIYPFFAAWFARSPELQKRDLSFLKSIGTGAGPLDYETVRLIEKYLPHIEMCQIYGITETMFLASSRVQQTYKTNFIYGGDDGTLISVGNLTPFVKAKVVDLESGAILGPGEKGVICVKTPCIMLGYLKNGQEPSPDDVDEDGWFRTGDYGYIDTDGNVLLMDRISFTFRNDLCNVFPSKIESVIQEHPSIQAAGVIGVPNLETGHVARAYVVVKPGLHVTADEIKQHVADRMRSFEHLYGGVRFLDALPENRNGKLDRLKLKEFANSEAKASEK